MQQEDAGISTRSQRAQSVKCYCYRGLLGLKESLFPNITHLAYAVVSVLRPVGYAWDRKTLGNPKKPTWHGPPTLSLRQLSNGTGVTAYTVSSVV